MKLTKAQIEGLATLCAWQPNFWIPTVSLNHDGLGTATLSSLREVDLVESMKDGRSKFWRITSRGRLALRSAISEPSP